MRLTLSVWSLVLVAALPPAGQVKELVKRFETIHATPLPVQASKRRADRDEVRRGFAGNVAGEPDWMSSFHRTSPQQSPEIHRLIMDEPTGTSLPMKRPPPSVPPKKQPPLPPKKRPARNVKPPPLPPRKPVLGSYLSQTQSLRPKKTLVFPVIPPPPPSRKFPSPPLPAKPLVVGEPLMGSQTPEETSKLQPIEKPRKIPPPPPPRNFPTLSMEVPTVIEFPFGSQVPINKPPPPPFRKVQKSPPPPPPRVPKPLPEEGPVGSQSTLDQFSLSEGSHAPPLASPRSMTPPPDRRPIPAKRTRLPDLSAEGSGGDNNRDDPSKEETRNTQSIKGQHDFKFGAEKLIRSLSLRSNKVSLPQTPRRHSFVATYTEHPEHPKPTEPHGESRLSVQQDVVTLQSLTDSSEASDGSADIGEGLPTESLESSRNQGTPLFGRKSVFAEQPDRDAAHAFTNAMKAFGTKIHPYVFYAVRYNETMREKLNDLTHMLTESSVKAKDILRSCQQQVMDSTYEIMATWTDIRETFQIADEVSKTLNQYSRAFSLLPEMTQRFVEYFRSTTQDAFSIEQTVLMGVEILKYHHEVRHAASKARWDKIAPLGLVNDGASFTEAHHNMFKLAVTHLDIPLSAQEGLWEMVKDHKLTVAKVQKISHSRVTDKTEVIREKRQYIKHIGKLWKDLKASSSKFPIKLRSRFKKKTRREELYERLRHKLGSSLFEFMRTLVNGPLFFDPEATLRTTRGQNLLNYLAKRDYI